MKTQRRLAAEILGVGKNKVWFDKDRLKDIKKAITRTDIELLIKEGAIKKKPNKRKKRSRKKKRLKRRGEGKIKKRVKKRKKNYIFKIRKIRKKLKYYLKTGKISKEEYHKLRKMAKSSNLTLKQIKERIEEK